MNYIEVKLMPAPFSEEVCDILAAELGPLGFDSFSTGEDSLLAYIPQNLWDSEALTSKLAELPIPGVEVQWAASEVVTQDWNQEWEQSMQFEPIAISDSDGKTVACVHSPVTPSEQVPECRYEIIIDPRMSFGTGTHETTSQLLETIIEVSSLSGFNAQLSAKQALDMGCGTGVLGILCGELGYDVRAIEIDDWVAANAVDNVLYNGLAGKVKVECGDASLLTEGPTYDLVLANINRNVLLADMARYVSVMLPGATLLMSGFYEEDVPAIRACAERLGLQYQGHRSRNNWVVIRFTLPQLPQN